MADPTISGGPGRPRRAETDRAIRDAALELLRSQGPGAVNIDAVSARSGVARTTIYRRHASRDELLRVVLDELVGAALPAPALPVEDKLRWLLDRIVLVMEEGIGRGGISAVLTGSDPGFTTALRERLAARLGLLTEAMTADVRAGGMSKEVDPDTVVGLLFGSYLGEVVLHGELRPGWADRTLELLVRAVAPPV